MKWMALYLAVMNLLGVYLMWTDKRRAKNRMWRVPEKVLFGCSLLGGSIGTWAGMYLFRHKTKHPKFFLGVPAILIAQVVLVLFIATRV